MYQFKIMHNKSKNADAAPAALVDTADRRRGADTAVAQAAAAERATAAAAAARAARSRVELEEALRGFRLVSVSISLPLFSLPPSLPPSLYCTEFVELEEALQGSAWSLSHSLSLLLALAFALALSFCHSHSFRACIVCICTCIGNCVMLSARFLCFFLSRCPPHPFTW